MFSSGLPSKSTTSARWPGAMRPQSGTLKNWAGANVAARSASAGVRPHLLDEPLEFIVKGEAWVDKQ